MKSNLLLSVTTTALVFSMTGASMAKGPVGELEEIVLILETNETDQDAEIVLSIKTDEAIQRLTMRDPDGLKILRLRSEDRSQIGLSQILVETAEPDVATILNSYPEGEYRIKVRTVSGELFAGTTELSHALLSAPTFSPSAGELVDSTQDLVVTWNPVQGASSYLFEVEQDDLGVNISGQLDANTTSFSIPAGFLTSGTEYDVGLATKVANGNVSVSEGNFETL